MGARALIRFLVGPVPGVAVTLSLLVAVFLLSSAARQEAFGEHYTLLLIVNLIGIAALLLLIAFNVARLVGHLRRRELGSRLTLRMLGFFVPIALIPLALVYYFSVQFISRGIDSWFDVRIEQALNDALLLGRTSLEAIKEDQLQRVRDALPTLSELGSDRDLVRELDLLRERAGFSEITLFARNGRVLAYSSESSGALMPTRRPTKGIVDQVRSGTDYANFEPAVGGGLDLRVVVPVFAPGPSLRMLQVVHPLPLRHARLGESVQAAFAEYERFSYLRAPLKFSFVLTLTLVTLMTLLISVWAALYFAQRLTAPIGDLAQGTRAVAAGDYETRLPVASSDELGVLVQSFNDMTDKVRLSQSQARDSQRSAEEQHLYLDTVLAHLSSGVVALDPSGGVRTSNAVASQILAVDLQPGAGLGELAGTEPRLQLFADAIRSGIAGDQPEWESEVALFGSRGRQILLCRGSRLPGGGHVVVFDDITALIQAQRDAAWAEVARRLAHEIKNPLTPIQLSAERIRHKYLGRLEGSDKEHLDRATRTIADQVESLKSMVNAFSSYAQPQRMQMENVDVHQLIEDVAELYRSVNLKISLQLDPAARDLRADRGRLRQVLNNLLTNARQALGTTADAEVRIITRRSSGDVGSFLELVVEDNGPGFPRDKIGNIFEPYVTTKEKGSGLGLAIVKKIVEEHGGTQWAENPPAGGARLTMRFPLAGNVGAVARIDDPRENIA